MTDCEVLPTQKVRLVDMKLAKHTGGKNRPKTILHKGKRKPSNPEENVNGKSQQNEEKNKIHMYFKTEE